MQMNGFLLKTQFHMGLVVLSKSSTMWCCIKKEVFEVFFIILHGDHEN